MKRTIALLIIVAMFVSITGCATDSKDLPAATPVTAEQFRSIGNIYITKDGDRYETAAYQDEAGEIYVSSVAMKTLFNENAAKAVEIQQKAYENLTDMCAAKQVSSFTYDDVLNAVYIWSDLQNDSKAELIALGENARIAYYDLGTPSDDAITYRQFFEVLDRAVTLADESKLAAWQAMFPEGRASEREMLRMEGMCAILYAAVALGTDYSEFNADWGPLDDAIGEAVWDEVDAVCQTQDPYEYLPNPYPYDLDGFVNAPYIRDGWDLFGVAYRYSFGRISLNNGMTLFDYDVQQNSMRLGDKLTVAEALSAVSRFLDSVPGAEQELALTDERVTTYSAEIITPELLALANQMPLPSDDDPPIWNGAVIGGDYEMRTIDALSFENDARILSEWGFNCVRYMLTYQTLFSQDASTVSEAALLQLDSLVAAAMRYRICLDLTMFTLPGRWSSTDSSTYTSVGEFDLFTNHKRQEEAKAVWALLAKRYADIPSSVLIFSPMWETLNYDLSTGLPYTPYTPDDVAAFYVDLVDVIRQEDNDRFILYEGTANNPYEMIIEHDTPIKEALESKYDNVQLLTNFCETTYVYAEMTADDGEHIDNNNHSMFKPSYPVTIYAAGGFISPEQPLVFGGELAGGTTFEMYLARTYGSGTLRITGDGEVLVSEALHTGEYQTGARLSGYYPYAQSDKLFSCILPRDVSELRVEYSGEGVEWSGIDVTLPERYAVERWWFPSSYDAFLAGENQYAEPELRKTATIQLSPNGGNPGIITINADISYTSEEIVEQATRDTIRTWGKEVAAFAPGSATRCESAAFNIGTQYVSAFAYYQDFLEMCSDCGIGWFTNDYTHGLLLGGTAAMRNYVGAERVLCGEGYVAKELLELYQAHMPTIHLED